MTASAYFARIQTLLPFGGKVWRRRVLKAAARDRAVGRFHGHFRQLP
ncbi:hypothetical protein [Ensifer sp. LCM 4579]|nr:hypothetical protein [Ensifer sp. LCM 4579]